MTLRRVAIRAGELERRRAGLFRDRNPVLPDGGGRRRSHRVKRTRVATTAGSAGAAGSASAAEPAASTAAEPAAAAAAAECTPAAEPAAKRRLRAAAETRGTSRGAARSRRSLPGARGATAVASAAGRWRAARATRPHLHGGGWGSFRLAQLCFTSGIPVSGRR
jgi:hypothetical protein